ncbi:MAG: carbohydrate binding domain-containing protein, partial [Clostridia bacterium]|nr:carbohydrate binding domain-containing protein [Clostridia bacterium]
MKRTYKLLAFIIALSMVMSTVILPASAAGGMTDSDYVAPAGENLFATWGLNYDYDTTATAVAGLYGYNQKDVAINKKGSPSVSATTTAGHEGKGAHVTSASADAYPRINYVPIEEGAVYKLSVDVKLVDTVSDTFSWAVEGNSANSITKPSKLSETVTATNSDWSTLAYVFKGVANTPTGNADRMHAHIGPKPTNATEYYLDNWSYTKIAAPALVSAVDNGDNSATFTFNKDLTDITESNFSVSPSATVSVSGSGKVYTVSLSNVTAGADYTITAQDIKDEYNQALSGTASVTVTTESGSSSTPAAALLPEIASITGEPGSYVFKDAGNTELTGWGQNTVNGNCTISVSDGVISVSDRVHSVNGLMYSGAAIESGKNYIISASMYAEAAVTDMSARFYIDGVDNIGLTNLKANEWVEVKGGFTPSSNPSGNIQFKIGKVSEASTLDYKIKDITLVEAPDLTGSLTASTKEETTATLTAAFSTPVELTSDSLTITGGDYTVEEVTKGNSRADTYDFSYTIKLTGLTAGTAYTVSVKDTLTDKFSQALTGTATANFTTDGTS